MNEVDGMKWEVLKAGKERSVIVREEDEGGRAMVMRDDERLRPGG